MDSITVFFWVMFGIAGGFAAGFCFALDKIKQGRMTSQGYSYSYFDTDTHKQRARLHRAMRQSR